jgi:Carboxypeptidase regulatory-like domain
MMRLEFRSISLPAFVLFATAASLYAQSANTGTLIGTATDPSGAVVPTTRVELKDISTNITRTAITNAAGQYSFPGVPPGSYSVKATATGFREFNVPRIVIEIGQSYTVNVQLEVGASQQVVEVTTTPGAELQTLDASVGSTVGGETLMLVPTLTRNVATLLLLQPTSVPQQASTQGSSYGGQVAGAHSDQNSIVLDGGNVTNGTSANSDYFVNFNGGPQGAIPTPVESIQEFRVSTSNHTASFSGASGSETILVTKRGSNEFHGSGYWFLQNSDLNANTWTSNRLGIVRPQSRDNRFGGSLGGYVPGLKEKAKTYFYMNYEGRRLVAQQVFSRIVPTDTLRQGILRFRDSAGNIVVYNLASAQLCGTQGNSACDPRALGINPLVNQLWSKYEPAGNDPTQGDGLNTTGFTAALPLPTTSDFGVVRLDHSFGSKWQAFGSYRMYKEFSAVNRQVDIGGLMPGDVKGQPASVSNLPTQPRYVVFGLTGALTPMLTNELSLSYVREWWYWNTASAFPQVPGTSAALELGGNNASALVPINLNTTGARQRLWNGHNSNLADNVSWLKGTHFIRAGGTFNHSGVKFFRDDGQVGLTAPAYLIQQSTGLNIPSAYQPPACSGTRTTACLPSNQISNWNSLYSQVLGLVDQGLQVGVRDSNLGALPAGTRLFNDVHYDSFSLYVTDSWKVTKNITINYGVNWSVDVPPVDQTGKQSISMVAPSNSVIVPANFLAARQEAALNGQVYNPTVEFGPLPSSGRKYPYDLVWNTVAPRVALAWTPKFGGGKMVIRGGYGQLFDRLNGVQKVGNEFQAFGFQQTLSCLGPSRTGQCLGSLGSDPSTGFRVGVDGATVPIPALSASAAAPLIPGNSSVPGANQPVANTTYQIDPTYRPGRNQQWDITIQRELPGHSLIEVGYIGRHANNTYNPLEINGVPWMTTINGQSYAQAYDAVAAQLAAGPTVTAQPFFESALAGSSLCAAPNTSCTAGVVAKYGSSFRNQQVTTVWNGIQPSFKFGQATASTSQVSSTFFYWASAGWSNYNAGFVSYRVRKWNGLTLDANLTFAHSLDTRGLNQDVDTASSFSYNLAYDYGTSAFDRKVVFNLLSVYELPFGKHGHGPLNYLAQGWSIAPIFTIASGLPLKVATGSGQEFGQGGGANSGGAILTAADTFGNSVHTGITGDSKTQVGINSNSATGGTGLNLFADPLAVFNSFRPAMVGIDTTSAGGGQLRGMSRWNLDVALSRRFKVNERWSALFSAQLFNAFNTVQFGDPSVSLQSPQSFGVLSSQLNVPRIIQLGLHIDF